MRLLSKQALLLAFFLLLFISIRSLYFKESLNFSADQGLFSLRAYELFKSKEFTLIGPTTSINFEGRQIFQGSVIYYFQLLFLVLGNFDPVRASYIFMLFCSVMILPLFFGVKKLAGSRVAWMMVIVYTLFPYYIDYTRFLWNPNFQLALTPLLILSLGYYQEKRNNLLLFLVGLLTGFLLLFHYQYLVILAGVFIYYLSIRIGRNLLILVCGFAAGFSPLLLFEIRNNFYNLNTLYLYLMNLNKFESSVSGIGFTPHYFLSIGLFGYLILFVILKKYISKFIIYGAFLVSLVVSISLYGLKPESGFGMKEGWNYDLERLAFEITTSQNLENFNTTNLIYDTQASVQKYLIAAQGLNQNIKPHGSNDYLFVIADDEKVVEQDPAYEITSFRPFERVNSWSLKEGYSLILLRRLL